MLTITTSQNGKYYVLSVYSGGATTQENPKN